jgi:hypothetical protein
MYHIQLIHWNVAEAAERAERLRALGYDVACDLLAGQTFIRALAHDPPAAVVIDLSRLPSQGRDMAVNLRIQGSTRRVPLLFVGGDPTKVARIGELLPDAAYTSWDGIGAALAKAIAAPPADPVVPGSAFAAYAGKPLAEKLGIKTGSTVALAGAPPNFRETLGQLPARVDLASLDSLPGLADLTIWFVRSSGELERGMAGMAAWVGQGALWIAWPKKGSALATDLSQQQVRAAGLAAGLVDFKICAIDGTWSALLFRQRKVKSEVGTPGPVSASNM